MSACSRNDWRPLVIGSEGCRFRSLINNPLRSYYVPAGHQCSNLYSYSASAPQLVQAISSNTWYHVRVSLNCTSDMYCIWVNGMLKQNLMAFQNNIASVDGFQSYTLTFTFGYYLALDAVDFSTDSQYTVERSTYLFLNSTQTLTTGSYSYRWQAWSSGVNFDQRWVPFTVKDDAQVIPIPDNVPLIATLVITNHRRDESVSIAISKNGALWQDQLLGHENSLVSHLTSGNYIVNCTNRNGTIESRNVTVLANNNLATYKLDFGYFKDVESTAWVWWVFAGGTMVFCALAGIYFLKARNRLARELRDERRKGMNRNPSSEAFADPKVK